MWLYELIEARHPDLVLVHPLKTKAIASVRIKTDKIDATTLAQLLRADLVPAAYIPPRDVRDTREVLRYRASLVRLRVQERKGVGSLSSRSSRSSAGSQRRFHPTPSRHSQHPVFFAERAASLHA